MRIPYGAYRDIVSGKYGWNPYEIQKHMPTIDISRICFVLSDLRMKPTAEQRQKMLVLLKFGHPAHEVAWKVGVPIGSVRWTRDVLLPLSDGALRRKLQARLKVSADFEALADEFYVPARCVKYLHEQMKADGHLSYRSRSFKRAKPGAD